MSSIRNKHASSNAEQGREREKERKREKEQEEGEEERERERESRLESAAIDRIRFRGEPALPKETNVTKRLPFRRDESIQRFSPEYPRLEARARRKVSACQ